MTNPRLRSQLQLNTIESVAVPLTVTLPLAGTPSVTVFAGVVVSRALQRLVVVTHTLLKVPAPAASVTLPLHGLTVATPGFDERTALPNPLKVGLVNTTLEAVPVASII